MDSKSTKGFMTEFVASYLRKVANKKEKEMSMMLIRDTKVYILATMERNIEHLGT